MKKSLVMIFNTLEDSFFENQALLLSHYTMLLMSPFISLWIAIYLILAAYFK